MAELTDAVGEQGVGAGFAGRQTEEAVGREEWNALRASAVKTRDHGNVAGPDGNETMCGDRDAGLAGEREGEDFAGCDVTPVVGFRKFGESEAAVGEGDGRFRARAAERRTLTEEVAEVGGGLRGTVHGVGRADESTQLDEGRKFADAGREEWTVVGRAKTERPDARGIVEGEDVVEVLVGFAVEDVLADGALDQ